MSTEVPELFRRFIDDAAVFPPGSASLPDAVALHRDHLTAWYAELVGPLLVPASSLALLETLTAPEDAWTVGLIGDTGIDGLRTTLAGRDGDSRVAQVELAVAKRGEDPQPGLAALLALLADRPGLGGFAEVPLTWGLLAALDTLAAARAEGVPVGAKFRTGGLAAELFPTPIELAAVICACRDRALPFKLTAGLHRAIRHTDPETGFVHHGFLNVLVASGVAASGAEVADVAAVLAGTDPVPLIEAVRHDLDGGRELWIGFGSCSIPEPLADLAQLGLLPGHASGG